MLQFTCLGVRRPPILSAAFSFTLHWPCRCCDALQHMLLIGLSPNGPSWPSRSSRPKATELCTWWAKEARPSKQELCVFALHPRKRSGRLIGCRPAVHVPGSFSDSGFPRFLRTQCRRGACTMPCRGRCSCKPLARVLCHSFFGQIPIARPWLGLGEEAALEFGTEGDSN